MMSYTEFNDCLKTLGLTQSEAARLLSVNERTVRRWAEKPTEIPGPAEQALRAWLRLERNYLPWRPDGFEIPGDSPETIADQIARYRQHAVGLDLVLRKVRARGGPAAPWMIDLKERRATLGKMWLTFHLLPNGGFSPAMYGRSDDDPDYSRDERLLEDGFACIAAAIAEERRQAKVDAGSGRSMRTTKR